MYLLKNILEIVLAVVFITINTLIAFDSQDETGKCEIEFLDKPAVKIIMQCNVLVNISAVWVLPVSGLRYISALIRDLGEGIKEENFGHRDSERGKNGISLNQ